MRRSREETAPQDLPGDLWHALAQLQHTHPDPVSRVGPLARPARLLAFTAAADTILAARVQLTGAETMRQVNETLRAMTGDLPHARFTGPGVALELTLSRRQELPIHAAHITGLTQLFQDATNTVGARSAVGAIEEGWCFHCNGTGLARPLWELAGKPERLGKPPRTAACPHHLRRAEVVSARLDVPAGLVRGGTGEDLHDGGDGRAARRAPQQPGVERAGAARGRRTGEALVTACAPGAQARWPSLYAKARVDGDRSVRTEAFDAMATGEWELAPGVWQETELLLWKPPTAWFSVNAFFTAAGLRNWYVNFERPTRRSESGFDTFDLTVDLVIDPDLTVDLVIDPDLTSWQWKDEDEYAHVRCLGIVTDTEHQVVELARAQALAMLEERTGPFADADRWASWRWNPAWPAPRLPQREEAGPEAVAASR